MLERGREGYRGAYKGQGEAERRREGQRGAERGREAKRPGAGLATARLSPPAEEDLSAGGQLALRRATESQASRRASKQASSRGLFARWRRRGVTARLPRRRPEHPSSNALVCLADCTHHTKPTLCY